MADWQCYGDMLLPDEYLEFNIVCHLSFPSVRSACDRRDYFTAPEGGKEQPYKAGRENTLDGGEEDFSGSPPAA